MTLAKNKVKITICGKDYDIVSDESVEYVRKIAYFVEDRIKQLNGDYISLSTNMLHMLALLNISDEYLKNKDSLFALKKEVRLLQEHVKQLEAETADAVKSSKKFRKENMENEEQLSALRKKVAELEAENAELKKNNVINVSNFKKGIS